MGWSIGYDEQWKRDIGYSVPAICDSPHCDKKIDRGLAYVCGGEPYGGQEGCGLFFCEYHLTANERCSRCSKGRKPYEPKPDTEEWMNHKRTDPSWSEWRKEHPEIFLPPPPLTK